MNGGDADFVALASKQLSAGDADIARLPLARVEASRPLPLSEGVNPAWVGAMATLARACGPLLGGKAASITEADWLTLGARLAPFEAWRAARPTSPVDKLDLERLRAMLALVTPTRCRSRAGGRWTGSAHGLQPHDS
jgi:hypothetical protein